MPAQLILTMSHQFFPGAEVSFNVTPQQAQNVLDDPEIADQVFGFVDSEPSEAPVEKGPLTDEQLAEIASKVPSDLKKFISSQAKGVLMFSFAPDEHITINGKDDRVMQHLYNWAGALNLPFKIGYGSWYDTGFRIRSEF